MDAATVCGLITEWGEQARRGVYERRWERDLAVWRAVLEALEAAGNGVQPATPTTRPPPWLAALVRDRLQMLATRWSHDSMFASIRAMERLGLAQLEPDDTYVLAAVGGIGGRSSPIRAATMRDDPELRDRVVWRMFEVEGGGEVSLANVDKYSTDGAGWRAAFVELTGDGTLPRERVLTSCLAALNRDFSAYRAGWYGRLYDALEPTVDEIAGHQGQLRSLLRSMIGATVTFSVSKLRQVDKAGLLDDAETLPALTAAVVAAPKGTALGAVRLAQAIAKRAPALGAPAADVAAAALAHPHADVQRAAATLLTALGGAERLASAEAVLEPSVRADVLGRPADPGERGTAPAAAAPEARPLAPVSGDEDLVERVAALLEDDGDPIELELVLAGLARLGPTARLQSLSKRALAILRRGPREGVTTLWLSGQVARLVLAADGVHLDPAPPAPTHAVAFLVRRLVVVEEILRGVRPPQLLLATPDDPVGWLAPITLVDRLERHPEPDSYDLVAALLRLHPDGRNVAMAGAAGLEGRRGDVVRYALGGQAPQQPRRLLRSPSAPGSPAWWIAAARTRSPVQPDAWLARLGVHGAGRSLPIEAHVVFRDRPFSWTDRTGVHRSVAWEWDIAVAEPAEQTGDDEPTAVAGRRYQFGGSDLAGLVGWLAVIYPHDCEHFLVRTVDSVLSAATATEVSHDAVRVLDAIACHPGRLGPLALTTIAAGLTASTADQRTHAVDTVLQLQRSGRLTGEKLAQGLVAIKSPATLTRLGAAMRDVATSDQLAADLVINALAGALPSFDPASRGIHALLDLLREELLRHGRPTPGALRPWLERFGGGSRASRTARALLSTARPR